MRLPVNYDALTRAERAEVRALYKEKQRGQCYYCKDPLSQHPEKKHKIDRSLFPNGFFFYPHHLHHDHKTGMTIGTVHAHCNAVLWQYHGE